MVVVVVGFFSGFDGGIGGNNEERNYGGSGGAVAAGEGDVAVNLKLVSYLQYNYDHRKNVVTDN